MKPDYKLIIIYISIAVLVALMISCSSSHKTVAIKKAHTDSSYVETKANSHVSNVDSTAKKTESQSYDKKTENHYEPIKIDSDYFIVDVAPLIVKEKKTGKQIIYLPVNTITEQGKIFKSDSGRVVKNNDSTVNEQKNVKVVSDIKTVDKNKTKIGFNWWWLLLLIPAPLLFKQVRQKIWDLIKHILFPIP